MPTLEKLYKQDPESLPFRQPVDPQLLQIPVTIFFFSKIKCYFFYDLKEKHVTISVFSFFALVKLKELFLSCSLYLILEFPKYFFGLHLYSFLSDYRNVSLCLFIFKYIIS